MGCGEDRSIKPDEDPVPDVTQPWPRTMDRVEALPVKEGPPDPAAAVAVPEVVIGEEAQTAEEARRNDDEAPRVAAPEPEGDE